MAVHRNAIARRRALRLWPLAAVLCCIIAALLPHHTFANVYTDDTDDTGDVAEGGEYAYGGGFALAPGYEENFMAVTASDIVCGTAQDGEVLTLRCPRGMKIRCVDSAHSRRIFLKLFLGGGGGGGFLLPAG